MAELWLYPDNSMILELSTKCLPSEAFQVAAETRAFLAQRGVDLTSAQETKTKKALDYFSKRLAERARLRIKRCAPLQSLDESPVGSA